MNKKYTFEPFPRLTYNSYNNMRFYDCPDGNRYPSITTCISKQKDKQEGLQKWRERVGEEQARIISRKAAQRGTAFHSMCEDYMMGEPTEQHKQKHFLAYYMFQEMKPYLDNINEIVLQETTMYSPRFKVAGRCDLIGEYRGELAIVDYKTTTTMKKREWIDDYFVQCAAYASMFEEHTSYPVDKLVIMMAAEDGQVEIFEDETCRHYETLEQYMSTFYDNIVLSELAA